MWKQGQRVTVTGYNKHKAIVKKCENENHHILAKAQRSKFKEARENLSEDCYLVGDGVIDTSRA